MNRLFKVFSLVLCISLLISLDTNASVIKHNESILENQSNVIIDYNEHYRDPNYLNDVLYGESFTTEIFSCDKSGRAVASPCNVSILIHYNDTRGAWLSVLIDAQDKTTEATMISRVSGTWLYAFDGGTTQRRDFDESLFIKRWTVNIEYDLGKCDSGTQIYAGVHVSAKMVYGYMPECSRTAIATVP